MQTVPFLSQDLQVIQVSDIDIGILAVVRKPDCLIVNQMYIVPEYQTKGIGKECMLRIIEDATLSNLPIRLQVLKVNSRAFAFYQRLGFKSTGESETHILMERIS